MILLDMLRWWYGRGWELMINRAIHRFATIGSTFSVNILLRTLFSPWRRIISYPGTGLDTHIRAMIDNFVSRCVGFCVRICALIVVVILGCFAIIFGIAQIILWPLVPVGIVALPAIGVLLA